MTKRHVSLPAAAAAGVERVITEIDKRLSSDEDTCAVVEDVLIDLFGDREPYEAWQAGETVSPATRVRLQGYDPCNATIESEYYAEKDESKFTRSKHLQWLWRQFDATPMADNVGFALPFRQMLAAHLFDDCGDNCRFFKGITVTYGHNISVGDNVVIHDGVHLDDRGRVTIGDRVSVSDGAHLYSHDHDVVDQTAVSNYHTIIEDDVRITYDAMIRAGCKLGSNSIVGARAIVQGDVPAHHIVVGMPAKSVKIKPGFDATAEPIETGRLESRRDERELDYELADDIALLDEFQRSLSPTAK